MLVTVVATEPVHEGRLHGQRTCAYARTSACVRRGSGACALPGGFAQVAGSMRGEGQQIRHHRQIGRAPALVSEIVPRVVTVGPGMSKVPFPILRRACPQAAISATLSCVTSRSVTKPLRQVTLPPDLVVPASGRAVRSASAPSRRGGPAIRRDRWRRLPEPRPAVRRIPCGAVCGLRDWNAPNRPTPPTRARRIPPDNAPDLPGPHMIARKHAVRHPADVVAAWDAPDAEERPRPGCPDPPKGAASATKRTDPAWETLKTPQDRYLASHIGRCAGTAHPAATRTDHPQILCSVQDIASHSLNHTSMPMKTKQTHSGNCRATELKHRLPSDVSSDAPAAPGPHRRRNI